MTFRTRLLVTFLLAVLLPMIALVFFIRDEMTDRLTAQYERRVESLAAVIEEDLSEEGESIAAALAVIRQAVVDDNRFRRAVVGSAADLPREERRYLLDYAGRAMQLAGLSMLQIQDENGRIISSGHFRNEFGRMEQALPGLLASTRGGTALVRARAPEAPFLALSRVDSVLMGNKPFRIVAGFAVERRFLARLSREAEMTVALVYPGGMMTSDADRSDLEAHAPQPGTHTPRPGEDVPRAGTGELRDPLLDPAGAIVREVSVPFIDSERGEVTTATFRITHELTELHALRSSVDRWFLLAAAAAVIIAVVLVSSLASRISRPLVELADKTSRIDLDRLDIDFDTHRTDEIGVLSRLLGAMTERLRASAVLIKDAERRATLGELSRQVNHDIKNGLTPIRNVFRHLLELSRNDPGQMPEVFQERQGTLDSSISYLENLASNYARLSPRSERRPCDVNEIVERVVMDLQGSGRAGFKMDLCNKAFVLGDPVSLRRVIENLVDNALDSLQSRPGRVTIATTLVSEEADRPRVRITVADTGIGMTETQRTKAFDDFYTTKSDGTGLGLNHRRLSYVASRSYRSPYLRL